MGRRTKIKICGLTTVEDALSAARLGADFLGFVFASSPRQVDPLKAREFWHDLPAGLPRVGVFKDQRSKEVAEVCRHLAFDYLQFHGRESPAICRSFALPVIKALSPRDVKELRVLELYRGVAEYYLVDLPKDDSTRRVLPGQIAGAAGRLGRPAFLAGGLGPENVGAFVRDFRPFGVDVARGVESEPGRKDLEKMRRFIEQVREASGSVRQGATP